MKNGNFAHRFLSENIHKITATRKMIVERMIIRILIFSLWVLIAILAKQNIIISRSSSKMAVFSEFDSSSFFLFLSSFWLFVAHEDESAFFDFVRETSLDKGTQRKTTENELPSLTQCTA